MPFFEKNFFRYLYWLLLEPIYSFPSLHFNNTPPFIVSIRCSTYWEAVIQALTLQAKKDMLSKEEVLGIITYCDSHNIKRSARLQELGISHWNFYKSRRHHLESEKSHPQDHKHTCLTGSVAVCLPEVVPVTDEKDSDRSRSFQSIITKIAIVIIDPIMIVKRCFICLIIY